MRSQKFLNSILNQALLALVLLTLYYLFSNSNETTIIHSFAIDLSFIVNGILIAIFLAKSLSEDKISIRTIFFFFNFIFFFTVPFAQYLTNRWMFFTSSNDNMFTANILITFWTALFILGYQSKERKLLGPGLVNRSTSAPVANHNLYTVKNLASLVAVGLIVLLSSYFIAVSGINGLLFRSGDGVASALGGWGPLGLIGEYYARPLPVFMFLFSIYYAKRIKVNGLLNQARTIIALLPAIILNFPTSTARFYAFTIYLGVFVIFTQSVDFVNSYIYLIILIFGIFGSSWINFSRYGDFSTAGELSFNTDFFFAGHFDAYENFVHTINYVSLKGIDWGNQLSAVPLFWLPRAAWRSKPEGTGIFLARYLSSIYKVDNKNISAPLIEELYLAFGIVGIIAGGFLLGAVAGWLDRKYKAQAINLLMNQGEPTFRLLYPFLIGLTLFVLRGDALSSFAYASGISAAYLTLRFFLIKKHALKLRPLEQELLTRV
jgi:hypothetical protein